MLTFVQVLDFIGTFAFAISGIRLGRLPNNLTGLVHM